jgi:hypothetical protein
VDARFVPHGIGVEEARHVADDLGRAALERSRRKRAR